MLTNKDLDEALVMAELTVKQQVDDAIKEWYRPDVEMEAQIVWAGMPDEMKRLVLQRYPEYRDYVKQEG